MKYKVTQFPTLKECLKALEQFIRNPDHLQTGKPIKRLGEMRPREILANWLLCVVGNFAMQVDQLTFSSDPVGGDGIICNTVTEETWPTEHVLVPRVRGGEDADAEALILEAITQKQNKGGAAYASGKALLVFLDAVGRKWFPNKVAKQLPAPLDFAAVWVMGPQGVEAGQYVYAVTLLDMSRGDAPAWRVRIGQDFDTWKIEEIQG
jgi:hypothetical protein